MFQVFRVNQHFKVSSINEPIGGWCVEIESGKVGSDGIPEWTRRLGVCGSYFEGYSLIY